MALPVATKQDKFLIASVGDHACVQALRWLGGVRQFRPVYGSRLVDPGPGVAHELAVRSGLRDVTAAEQHDLVMQWIVSQRAARPRWRRVRGSEIAPTPPGDI